MCACVCMGESRSRLVWLGRAFARLLLRNWREMRSDVSCSFPKRLLDGGRQRRRGQSHRVRRPLAGLRDEDDCTFRVGGHRWQLAVQRTGGAAEGFVSAASRTRARAAGERPRPRGLRDAGLRPARGAALLPSLGVVGLHAASKSSSWTHGATRRCPPAWWVENGVVRFSQASFKWCVYLGSRYCISLLVS